ncbi:MAG: glycerol-3-phosphate 1-O-acyltransferase PlsY [Acutalibacteraceae bacterium]|jgi:glycerol-3-phosphate acyltransferase PlsY
MEILQCNWLPLLIGAAIAYLLGSINFAIIITKLMNRGDIRDYGSGNAGATNMLRSQGKGAAALTAVGDIAKGMLAVFIGGWLVMNFPWGVSYPVSSIMISPSVYMAQVRLVGHYIAGLFCILGHMYPLYFGFRGGKGVLATLGMTLILDWRVALFSLGVFILIVIFTRLVSLGSIIAAVVQAIATFGFRAWIDHQPMPVVTLCTIMASLIGALLIVKHIPNIKRIAAGTESKLGQKTTDKNEGSDG